MSRIIQLYKNAFGGLSRPAWMLALVMLINRSGTMVMPFLGIYLTSGLGFSLKEAGVVLSCFGVGSMAGSFLGGWLTDKFGSFYIQFLSLVLGGILFLVVAGISDYHTLAIGVFILSTVAETFRPANSSSVSHYARPENISRAFSLNRMAINLGFSVGPAIGGLLAAISFKWLFIADGATCIIAGLLFFFYFRNVKGHQPARKQEIAEDTAFKTAYHDIRFIGFIALTALFAILFFQLFVSLPLYYRDVYHMSEGKIGALIAFNGVIVFTMEMVMVYILSHRIALNKLIATGLILVGAGFAVLNLAFHPGILVLSMVILSIAEIFAMPFMMTYAVKRSGVSNRGSYMGLYSFAYSTGHVFSPLITLWIIDRYGFIPLWWLSGIFGVIVGIGFLIVTRK
jgi:predicted MFS family arabinose efflux permease